MKTISKLVFSAVAVLATMGFSAGCYADVAAQEVDLPCCTGTSCPTRFVSEGIPEVQQSARVSGIKIHDTTVPREGTPGHDEWKTNIRYLVVKAKTMSKEQGMELLGASRAQINIYAMCVGLPATHIDIGKIGSSITCPIGVGIEFDQEFPRCEDPQTGPHSVVEITKVSLKEAIENQRAMNELQRQIEMSRQRVRELDAECAANQRKMEANTQRLGESFQRVVGGGYPGGVVLPVSH